MSNWNYDFWVGSQVLTHNNLMGVVEAISVTTTHTSVHVHLDGLNRTEVYRPNQLFTCLLEYLYWKREQLEKKISDLQNEHTELTEKIVEELGKNYNR